MIFESTPPVYSSVNDPLVYVAYDAHAANPTTYPNYKYVGEVWINGALVFTGKYFPNPTTNRGIMDFSNIVREYVVAQLQPTGSGILAQELGEGAWSLSVVIKMREEYSGTVGAIILTDSTRTFFNHYNGRINDFTILGNYDDVPTTDRPTTIDMTFANANYFIPYFSETTASFNVVITGGTSTRTKTITPTAANTLQILNISPLAINVDYAGNFTASTTSYTVAFGGVTYTINLLCEGMYPNYIAHFMNKFGGYESMLFNKVSKRFYDIERKAYNQLGYRVSASGVVSVKSGSTMYQQKTEFAGKFKERLRMNSDWLSDLEYQWLAQLVTSPQVFIEDAGTLYPVVITANNYEFKEHIVDGLINLAIDVEFGTSYKTQFQ
jgi:hypothetical protein